MSRPVVKDRGGAILESIMNFDGCLVPSFAKDLEACINTWNSIPGIKLRQGDVFLSTPVKSGTHWTFEILYQLLHGSAETSPYPKVVTMIEASSPEDLENIPSPRILNSHLEFSRLPKEVQAGQCKIILVLRNPKDVFFSMYKHHIGTKFYEYSGKWVDYFPLLLNGELEYGSWFDMVLDWEKRVEENKDTILLVYYENLKQNGFEEVSRIANFIGAKANETLIRQIVAKTDFEKMKVDKQYKGEIAETMFRPDFNIFRKGMVGDWKEHFTVAQNEMFDKIYEEKMKNSKLKFQFE